MTSVPRISPFCRNLRSCLHYHNARSIWKVPRGFIRAVQLYGTCLRKRVRPITRPPRIRIPAASTACARPSHARSLVPVETGAMVGVGVGVSVGLGVAEGLGVGEGDGDGDAVAVRLAVGEPDS